jgi:hypothetical protein
MQDAENDFTQSTWYQNISSRHHCTPQRMKKAHNTKTAPPFLRTNQISPRQQKILPTLHNLSSTTHTEGASRTTTHPYTQNRLTSFAPANLFTLVQNSKKTKKTISVQNALQLDQHSPITQTSQQRAFPASNTLIASPFIRRKTFTMTSTEDSHHATTGSYKVSKPSDTLTTIANSIADKINLSPNKTTINMTHGKSSMPFKLLHNGKTQYHNIPTTVPPPPTDPIDPQPNKLCIPINIRIKNPTPTKSTKFDYHRILEALLHAFQHVDGGCSI